MTSKHPGASSPDVPSVPPNASTMSSNEGVQRLPPPEKPEAARTRFKVIATFWAVIIFLGFPLWWQTTSIHRARLPFQEMSDWADGKV